MCTSACLHTDHTRGQVGEERSHLIASESLLQHALASLVDAVDLEHVFRQIDANCRNVHDGRPFRFEWLTTLPLWHTTMPFRMGASIPLLSGQPEPRSRPRSASGTIAQLGFVQQISVGPKVNYERARS